MKLTKYLFSITLATAGVAMFSSCEDMLDKGNSYVIYADDDHLTSSSDTVTSMAGILAKLQAIAVRTNLLGEVRADMVKVNDNAIVDLKNLANLDANVTGEEDKNAYNNPRDYFAIINNCNYFLERVKDTLPEIHTPGMNYMFEREVAAVHCIRAWTYLQAVLAYGEVPFFEKPVLSLSDSKSEYPMYGIDSICSYFIKDLKPYVNIMLPEYNSFNGENDIQPKMCFFPANIVLGDLYLWQAASLGRDDVNSVVAAKEAAKSYYDFIMWNLSGKERTVTSNNAASWPEEELTDKIEMRSFTSLSSPRTTGAWGKTSSECITAIAMDKNATTGMYNELRNLYNYNDDGELSEASISPSDALKTLSQAQVYVDYDEFEELVEVTAEDLHQDAIEKFKLGDLRLSSFYTTSDYEYNEKELKLQQISKHDDVNVLIYRVQQLYLRLAEALNYAGYPRFAKQILTTGLSNTVIDNEVRPYYTSSTDSAFIDYFDFSDNIFKPRVTSYSPTTDTYGIITGRRRITLSNQMAKEQVNMLGIHSRGSGISFLNEKYLPVIPVDSTVAEFPQEAQDTIGIQPSLSTYTSQFPSKPTGVKAVPKPSTWDSIPGQVADLEYYSKMPYAAGLKNDQLRERAWNNYTKNDSVGKYAAYLEAVAVYEEAMAVYSADTAAIMSVYRDSMAVYNRRLQAYRDAWHEWNGKLYSNPDFVQAEQEQIDQAILDEEALELAFEGSRYYDLMRRALWYRDDHRLNDPISEARPELAGKLLDKNNWFLNYKNKIGLHTNYKW